MRIYNHNLDELIEQAPVAQVGLTSIKKFLGPENASSIGVVIENLKEYQGPECAHCMKSSSQPRNVVPICKVYTELKIVQVTGMKLLCEPCFELNRLISDSMLQGVKYNEKKAYQMTLLPLAKGAKIGTTKLTKELDQMASKFEELFTMSFTWDLTFLVHRNLTSENVRHFDFESFKVKKGGRLAAENTPEPKVREYTSTRKTVMPDEPDDMDDDVYNQL